MCKCVRGRAHARTCIEIQQALPRRYDTSVLMWGWTNRMNQFSFVLIVPPVDKKNAVFFKLGMWF